MMVGGDEMPGHNHTASSMKPDIDASYRNGDASDPSRGAVTTPIIYNNIDSTKIKKIKKEGYGVTSIATETNSKYLIIEINKKELNNLKTLIKSFDSKAFIYINETKTIENGYIK